MAVKTRLSLKNNSNGVQVEDQSKPTASKWPDRTDREYTASDVPARMSRESESLSIPFLPATVPDSRLFVNHDGQIPSPLQLIPCGTTADVNEMNSQLDVENGTQKLSQSYYQSLIQRGKSVGVVKASKNYDEDQDKRLQIHNGSAETQRTYEEGEEGHIDIVSSLPSPQDDIVYLQDSEPLDFSPSQPRLTQYPESQRFKTPALAGKKRYHTGDTVERSGQPRNPLRNGQPTPSKLMGLSQVFAGTQAASSPFSNGLPTNPRSDRPSPNINLQTRPATAPSSSPLRPISDMRYAAPQPATKYIPMRLSQAERERQTEMDLDIVAEDDDDFEIDPSQTRRLRRRKERESRIRTQLLTQPSHSSPVQFRGGITSSPLRSRHHTPGVNSDPGVNPEPLLGQEEMEHLPDTDDNTEKLTIESEAETEEEDAESKRSKAYHGHSTDYEDKENHSVIVQRTAIRLQHATNTNIAYIEASPCVRHSYNMPIQLEPRTSSGEAVRIADSQPSPRSSQHSSPPKATTGSDTNIPPVMTHLSLPVGNQVVEQDQSRNDAAEVIEILSNEAHTGLGIEAENYGSFNTASIIRLAGMNNMPERSGSDARQLSNQTEVNNDLTALAGSVKAATHQPFNDNNPKSDEASSQPVIRTPPGRRRKRMLDISAESPSLNSTPKFNLSQALQLDPDKETATFLEPSPRRRITYSHKRQHTKINPIQNESAMASTGESRDNTFFTAHDLPLSSNDVNNASNMIELSQEIIRPIRKGRYSHAKPVSLRAVTEAEPRKSVWDIEMSPPKTLTPKPKTINRSKQVLKVHTKEKRKSQSNTVTPKATNDIAATELNHVAANAIPDNNLAVHNDTGSSVDAVIAPNMVFACFNGKFRAYYPAFCLGLAGSDSKRYRIQWEGYEPDEVDAYGVRTLDLRIGDAVKVNMNGFAKVPYVVHGFKNQVSSSDNCITDIHGYKTLIVAPKQRKSLPVGLTVESTEEIPVAAVYLDNNMWNQMKSRMFDYMATNTVAGVRSSTPSVRIGTPSTPSTRNRRHFIDIAAEPVQQSDGLFSNMMFAMSYEDSDRKHALMDLVRSQGGTILSDSFHELLESEQIQIKDKYSSAGFTALLTERHSRKEKYMQALALGLPCLSGRWIEACSKNGEITDWQNYLLPAGESAELDGATRSRILPNMNPGDVKLSHIIETRPNLLSDAAAVVVVGRGKMELKRAPYVLLVQALGAGKVTRVADIHIARDLVESDSTYKWLFVDDKDVESTKSLLRTHSNQEKRKKQKVNVDTQEQKCAVAGNEFIIQSVILGKLFEE